MIGRPPRSTLFPSTPLSRSSRVSAVGAAADEPREDLFAVRRRKLDELRAAGVDPFPHQFDGVEPIAAVRAAHPSLEAGEGTRSEEHTSELQSQSNLGCRLLL